MIKFILNVVFAVGIAFMTSKSIGDDIEGTHFMIMAMMSFYYFSLKRDK